MISKGEGDFVWHFLKNECSSYQFPFEEKFEEGTGVEGRAVIDG